MPEPEATAHTPQIIAEPAAHQEAPVPPDLDGLLRSWERSLRAAGRSEKTIKDYLRDTRRFARFLAGSSIDGEPMPTEPPEIARPHVEEFILYELARTSQSSAASAYRRVQQWFRWLLEEDEIDVSPMANMRPPKVDEAPPPVRSLDDIAKLFAACAGRAFPERRDLAMVRVLLDTGLRRAECAGIELDRVDLDASVVRVRGKGGAWRDLPVGPKAVAALDRYLRARAKHRYAELPWLWLGQRGRITGDGVRDIVDKRCDQAGIDPMTPHQFRHTLAHEWQLAEGNETDLMAIMGWSSRDMLGRYGRSAAVARARASHKRLAIGDRI